MKEMEPDFEDGFDFDGTPIRRFDFDLSDPDFDAKMRAMFNMMQPEGEE